MKFWSMFSMLWEHYVKGKNNDTKYHQLYNFVFDVESRWTQTVRKWSFPGPEVGKKLEGPLLGIVMKNILEVSGD
jgi:hypothetical protein